MPAVSPDPSRPGRPAAYRLWYIHLQLKSGRHPTVAGLARDLEVSRRTIERDIAYLRDVFAAPLEYDRRRNGYRYTEPTFELSPMTLSEGEVAALLVMVRLLSEHLESPLAPVVQRAIDRLMQLLPAEVLVEQAEFERFVTFGPGHALDEPQELARRFEALMTAITERRRLRIRYYTASRREEGCRDVDPYNLYFARGSWYLIAYCHRRRDILLFALQRIRAIQPLAETFTRPEGYAPEEFMRHAWQAYRGEQVVDVTLRFAPTVAHQVQERRWHPTQRSEPQEDGSLLLHLQVAVTPELEGWVLRWGEFCQVLDPPGLRAAVRRRLGAALEQYGEASRSGSSGDRRHV